MRKAVLTYKGQTYESASEINSTDLLVLVNAGSRYTGIDWLKTLSDQSGELANLLNAVSLVEYNTRRSAKIDLIDTLEDLFPGLPAAELVNSGVEGVMSALLAVTKTFGESVDASTEIDVQSGQTSGVADDQLISLQ